MSEPRAVRNGDCIEDPLILSFSPRGEGTPLIPLGKVNSGVLSPLGERDRVRGDLAKSSTGPGIKGWCPGALRPMESGGGLILRVRPRLSKLSLVQLEALGRAAQRFGSGSLHLTNRANAVIRGIPPAGHAAALEILAAAGLIDSDPRAEAVRNVMLLPVTVVSRQAAIAEALTAALEQLLAASEALYGLPGKFGIAVQAGSGIDTGAFSDVTFLVQEDRIAMLLEGAPQSAAVLSGTQNAADAFLRVALVFLRMRDANPDIRRMRDAVDRFGLEAISKEARLAPIEHGLQLAETPAPVGDLGDTFGIAFAFGEIGVPAHREITRLMRQQSIPEAALSPRRALVFPVRKQDKGAFQELAQRISGITSPEDLRLRVHACPGAPACPRATVQARRDAEAILAALGADGPPDGTIHISGCGKRCAYPHGADITAIGTDGGRYTVLGPHGQMPAIAADRLAGAVAELAGAR
jgi:precorrin-3B synthase